MRFLDRLKRLRPATWPPLPSPRVGLAGIAGGAGAVGTEQRDAVEHAALLGACDDYGTSGQGFGKLFIDAYWPSP
jgi:hypothetical protein